MDELEEERLLLRIVTQFGSSRVERLAIDVICELRTYPACGLFGDDVCARNLWDEYCYDQQHGPAPLLEDAWNETLAAPLAQVLQPLEQAEATLLTFYCGWDQGDDHTKAWAIRPME